MVIESNHPLEIGQIYAVRLNEEDLNSPKAMCKVIREISQEEYIEISRLEDPEFESRLQYYMENRPYFFRYEVQTD